MGDILTNLELIMAEAPVVKVRAQKERRDRNRRKPRREQEKLARKNTPSRRTW